MLLIADRLIADRRPRNYDELQLGPVRLPYAPRLRRVRMRDSQKLWFAKRDLANCFYLFRVDEERWPRQVLGPRIPRSWFEDLENLDKGNNDNPIT